MEHALKLEVIVGEFSVAKLSANSAIPSWAVASPIFSITRSTDELSIICGSSLVPMEIEAEHGWACIKVVGPLDFALTGVLAALAGPLARAKISIFALSTFDTDFILVKRGALDAARSVLRAAGHSFLDES